MTFGDRVGVSVRDGVRVGVRLGMGLGDVQGIRQLQHTPVMPATHAQDTS